MTPAEPLRSLGAMMLELAYLELDYMRGVATGEWRLTTPGEAFAGRPGAESRAQLLGLFEEIRAQTWAWWPAVTEERLLTTEPDPFFGGPADMLIQRLEYAVENENHHRARRTPPSGAPATFGAQDQAPKHGDIGAGSREPAPFFRPSRLFFPSPVAASRGPTPPRRP